MKKISENAGRRRCNSRKRGNRQLVHSYNKLEERQLLCTDFAGSITSDTAWSDDCYNITGDVTIDAGVTLTISPGTAISSSAGTLGNNARFVVDGTLMVNEAEFVGANNEIVVRDGGNTQFSNSEYSGREFEFRGGSRGTVTGSRFNSGTLMIAADVDLSSNTFASSEPIEINPTYADELYDDNVFEVDARVSLSGVMNSDAEIRPIENLSRFYLASGITINDGATLTISPDTTISSSPGTLGNNAVFLVDGRLIVNGADFVGANNEIVVRDGGDTQFSNSEYSGREFEFRGGSRGTVTGSRFNSGMLMIAADVDLSSNTFANSEPIEINPTYADELYDDNVFEVDARVSLSGVMNSDAEIRQIENLSRFYLARGITINDGVTLTISPSITISSSPGTLGNNAVFLVDGTLIANNTNFAGANNEIIVRDGGITELNDSQFAGQELSVRSGGELVAHCSTILPGEVSFNGAGSYSLSNNSILSSTIQATGSSTQTINLRDNYWGTSDANAISQKITDNNDDDNLPTIDFSGFLLSEPTCEPEIVVIGQGVMISDDDVSPSSADGTDFGSTIEGRDPVRQDFIVRNDGDVPLALSNLVVPAGFTIVEVSSCPFDDYELRTSSFTIPFRNIGRILYQYSID
ncbi:MAG: hypothetical protein AAGA30_14735 [Planctomycetota bacterium]